MTDPTTPAPTEAMAVEQVDREAAAEAFDRRWGYQELAAFVRAGRADGDRLVQAFARHRLTASAHDENLTLTPNRAELMPSERSVAEDAMRDLADHLAHETIAISPAASAHDGVKSS